MRETVVKRENGVQKETVSFTFEGRNGTIIEVVAPNRLPTEKEIEQFYRRLAEIILGFTKKHR